MYKRNPNKEKKVHCLVFETHILSTVIAHFLCFFLYKNREEEHLAGVWFCSPPSNLMGFGEIRNNEINYTTLFNKFGVVKTCEL